MNEKVLTRREAMEALRMSPATFSRLCTGKLPNLPRFPLVRIGRAIRIREAALVKWMKEAERCNAAACEYIAADLPDEVETLILGHLSENHNVPYLAEHDAREALVRRGLSPLLAVAEPRRLGPLFHL